MLALLEEAKRDVTALHCFVVSFKICYCTKNLPNQTSNTSSFIYKN